ncbi:N,N-dimethylformamidase beta subunit family domain-containing protein [Kitasatospora sp. NBC_00315]|uniref:N,N-dimethylformamidase beta subunit family domain-containing protein n=1 Tax=Kitasatospora sp. NBC_00315 TaxID=2975963 RepID=UPI003253A2E9
MSVEDAVDGRPVHQEDVTPGSWELAIPNHWRSSLYRAVFSPGEGERGEVWFVVRPGESAPRSAVLLSVPFATWQAYNRAGVPGEGLYWTEDPDRATRVSFDRPGGGPPPERWEDGLMRWLRAHGPDVDYCSNLDLHLDPRVLLQYRLLVVNGHDEYWSWEMRDRVEGFVRAGGNLAVFGANTAWWQMRLEDGGRTMVCHRDAATDPVTRLAPERATVEWSSAPVNRPENALTGLSFRQGAGCWGPGMSEMYRESYTAAFAGHWVFEGTGLADGDSFARGALGYETDAADLDFAEGVPAATGRDGTPASFAVLATADLRHWDAYGQGGWAVMGVFDSGAGTVFNAGTVNWGAALADPVVERITRNVLDRLSAPPRGDRWTVLGSAPGATALAGAGAWLFAALPDGSLGVRAAGPQNLPFRPVGPADGLLALAAPREAVVGGPFALYAADRSGRLLIRPARPEKADWTRIDRCPPGTFALALCDGRLFALDGRGALWTAPQGAPADGAARDWTELHAPSGLRTLTAVNGRLYASDARGALLHRRPDRWDGWHRLGPADGSVLLAGQAGRLVGLGADGLLRSRGVLPETSTATERAGSPARSTLTEQLSRPAGPDGVRRAGHGAASG